VVSPNAEDLLVCVDCSASDVHDHLADALGWRSDPDGWRCAACAASAPSVTNPRSTQPDAEWSWREPERSGVRRALAAGANEAVDPRERPTVPCPPEND
jgi:hypothetical protein